MSLLSRIAGRLFAPRRTVQPKPVRGGYDAASYDLTNEKHWAAADSYSPNAQLDSGTRQLLRDRSRYEASNNGYYGGVIETIGGDVVGSGPRPQVNIPGDDGRKLGRLFENWFRQWGQASAWAEDLTLMQEAEVRDGEAFGVLVNNPGLVEDGRTKVSIDLAIYEAEQVSDPWDYGLDPLYADGVRVDGFGNPIEYTFLKNHPGGVSLYRGWETETIPAWQVCHWYKRKRAGQTRGVPWMVAALPLFAQLRRYTLATLSAAELAAMLAGVMKTDAAAGEQAVTVEAMDSVAMVRGALLTLPSGWDASQFKPEQPVTSYGQFKTEILNEVGRGGNVPLNIVSGNSSGYNYSSARLDRQLYYAAIRRQRERMAARFLDRVFMRWAREAVIQYGVECPPPEQWSWTWFWDGIVSIDPQKDADADAKNLENNTTTLAEICAERGLDWEEVVRQRAAEKKLIEELGAGPEEEPPPEGGPPPEPQPVAGSAGSSIRASVKGKFDESKHSRGEDGKFGSGGAGGAAKDAAKDAEKGAEKGAKDAEKAGEKAADKAADKAGEKAGDSAKGSDSDDTTPKTKEQLKASSQEEIKSANAEHSKELKAAERERKSVDRKEERAEAAVEEKFRDEDDDIVKAQEKKEAALEKSHDRARAELEKRQNRESERDAKRQDKELEDAPDDEAEIKKISDRHDKENEEEAARHQGEFDKLGDEQEKEVGELEAKHEAERKEAERTRDERYEKAMDEVSVQHDEMRNQLDAKIEALKASHQSRVEAIQGKYRDAVAEKVRDEDDIVQAQEKKEAALETDHDLARAELEKRQKRESDMDAKRQDKELEDAPDDEKELEKISKRHDKENEEEAARHAAEFDKLVDEQEKAVEAMKKKHRSRVEALQKQNRDEVDPL